MFPLRGMYWVEVFRAHPVGFSLRIVVYGARKLLPGARLCSAYCLPGPVVLPCIVGTVFPTCSHRGAFFFWLSGVPGGWLSIFALHFRPPVITSTPFPFGRAAWRCCRCPPSAAGIISLPASHQGLPPVLSMLWRGPPPLAFQRPSSWPSISEVQACRSVFRFGLVTVSVFRCLLSCWGGGAWWYTYGHWASLLLFPLFIRLFD